MTRGQSAAARAVLWYVPALYGLCFFAGSFLQLRYFALNDVDFSYFLVQPWRIWTFGDWNVPFANAIEGGAPFWAHHLTPLSALLAPVIGLFPSEYALAAVHAASAALMAFLLPRLAREIYGGESGRWLWGAAVCLLLFFFFRPYMAAWHRQTHFTTLVAPILALACLCLHKRRVCAAFACALVVCMGQERASVSVFGLGMYAFLLAGQRRAGIVFCSLSALWFFGATQVWLPLMRGLAGVANTDYIMLGRIGPLADWPEKLVFLCRICLFCCFLPFCGRRAMSCACCSLPNLSMALLSGRPGMYDLKGQYEDLPSVFLLLSMLYGLCWLQGKLPARLWKRLFASGVCVYWLLVSPSNAGWYNPLVTSARILAASGKTELDKLNEDIGLLKDLPDSITPYVQSGLGPRLGLHKNRLLLQRNVIDEMPVNALLVFSPLAGTHELGGAYDDVLKLADNNPGFGLLFDTGRLRVYASSGLLAARPEFIRNLYREKNDAG